MAVSKAAPLVRENEGLTRPQSLVDAVYGTLMHRLLTLDIAPGERIGVDDLARSLNVSQTPIREALVRLESQGLVTKVHLVGYRAAPQPSHQEFEQLFEARMQLEPFVAKKAAALIQPDTIDWMEGALQELLAFESADDTLLARFSQADSDFHQAIAIASGNLVLARMLESLNAQVRFTLFRKRERAVNLRPALLEHRRILRALRKGDGEEAGKAMQDHLRKSRSRYWP